MNLEEISTPMLVAWDARIRRDLEVFVPTYIPEDGETAQNWRRYRRDIRAEIRRRGDEEALRQPDNPKVVEDEVGNHFPNGVPDGRAASRPRVLEEISRYANEVAAFVRSRLRLPDALRLPAETSPEDRL
ncbi:MAG: hypothetical protein ACLQGP_10270 [Isosphaeraceae bacterium]